MSKTVFSCRPSDALTVPAQMMWEHDVGCVPVLAEGTDAVIALITDRDLAMAVFLGGGRLEEINVARAMSNEVWWCEPDQELEAAMAVMRERQVHRLPVLDAANRLVGFLSINDIARRCAEEEVPECLAGDIVATIAAIHTSRKARVAPGTRTLGAPRPKTVPYPLLPRAVDDVAVPS